MALRGQDYFLALFVNVNAKFVDGGERRLAGFTGRGGRFPLNGDRYYFIGLILPGYPQQSSAHPVNVVTREPENLR